MRRRLVSLAHFLSERLVESALDLSAAELSVRMRQATFCINLLLFLKSMFYLLFTEKSMSYKKQTLSLISQMNLPYKMRTQNSDF